MTAAAYTTSYEPASPTRTTHRMERSPSPSPTTPFTPTRHSLPGPGRRQHLTRRSMAAQVKRFLTPRVLTPVVLWLICLWLIHRYVFAFPTTSIHGWRPSILVPHPEVNVENAYLEAAFPDPPPRQGEDALESVSPLYRPFQPLPEQPAPFPVLRPTRFLPKACLESWFINGELACSTEDLGEEDTLDATWLWVNGSDTRWQKDMQYWSKELGVNSPVRHFREQNELKYSMRSVVKALKGRLRTVHLVLYDYAFNPSTDLGLLPQSTTAQLEREYGNGEKNETGISQGVEQHLEETWRVVQTPSWLKFSAINASTRSREGDAEGPATTNNDPNFRYAGHSEIFQLPTSQYAGQTDEEEQNLGETEWKRKDWKAKALPTYNSMAIEGRIGWIPGLADVSVAMNDDFFMLQELSVSDFHSPLFGSVIRFDSNYYQQVRPVLEASRQTEQGEMGGLYHANWLLSKRFPKRLRPYFAHAPKTITRNLHHEASIMFQEAMTISGTRRFREAKIGVADVQIQWLLTSLRVERWREAMLWTWVVANMGAKNGNWDNDVRQRVKDLFGLGDNDDDVAQIEVHRGERWTMKKERVSEMFVKAGWGSPKSTEYLFSSMDGHMPDLQPKGSNVSSDVCILDLDSCFGSFWSASETVSADEMFKRLTFDKSQCGDCLLMALVTASGPLGLSALFPPTGTTFVNPSSGTVPGLLPPPHLPLTPTWQEADFSLESVMSTTALPGEEVDLREYCMYLLSRYLYINGRSVVHFYMLKKPDQARKVFNQLDRSTVTILGINDDIEDGYPEVRKMMGEWFESRWSEPTVWERQ